MSSDDFYLHEDEWGMISFELRENHADCLRVMDEATVHSEAHRAPDGIGWRAMYIAPETPIAFETRGITFEALRAELGPTWVPYARLFSGYSSYREELTRSYALRDMSSPDADRAVIYGSFENRLVASLCITRLRRQDIDLLHRLGVRFGSILSDLWRHAVVDLSNLLALRRYFDWLDSDE